VNGQADQSFQLTIRLSNTHEDIIKNGRARYIQAFRRSRQLNGRWIPTDAADIPSHAEKNAIRQPLDPRLDRRDRGGGQ